MNNSLSANSATKLHRNLSLWHIIIIGLAYIQPMTLFDTFGLVSQPSQMHVPTSYIIALIAILLTSISYGNMIRQFPSSGSAYTYAQKAFNPTIGFMVGWSSWVDYLLSPMVNILLANIYLVSLFPEVNHWVWIVGLVGIMTGVNLFGARIVAYFNSWIVFIQLAIIAVFVYMVYHDLSMLKNADGAITDPSLQLWSLRPFFSENAPITGLISGATILCFSFTGFDALSSLAEETKNTKTVLPKAIFLTSLIAGLIFIASTYFMQLYFPGEPSKYFADITATQPDILLIVGGSVFQAAVLGFAIITVLASGISAHAGVARLMYVMGRDGVINKRLFGHISPKLRTPTYNILIAGAIALLAGLDSVNVEHVISVISFGALTAFSFVNLSVIKSYVIDQGKCRTLYDIFSYIIIPILGFISIIAMWFKTQPVAFQVGIAWAVIGIIYLAIKTSGFKKPVPQYHEEDVYKED